MWRWDFSNAEYRELHRNYNDITLSSLVTGIQQESAALQALRAALDKGDRQQIIGAAMAVKPPFSQVFMLFGDFTLVPYQ
jgi:hypothetical protein